MVLRLWPHGLTVERWIVPFSSEVRIAPLRPRERRAADGDLLDDSTLTLHAELVALSACHTGLGDLKKAERTIEPQRAFLAKGARSVLVSL